MAIDVKYKTSPCVYMSKEYSEMHMVLQRDRGEVISLKATYSSLIKSDAAVHHLCINVYIKA